MRGGAAQNARATGNGRADRGPVTAVVRDGETTLIRLAGELDMATVPLVREVIDRESDRRPSRLTLDLADVRFLDSSAINLVISVHRGLRAEGCDLMIANPSETVVRTMQIAHLHGLLAEEAPRRLEPTVSRPEPGSRAQSTPPR